MKKSILYRAGCIVIAILITGYLFIHVSYAHRGYARLMGFYDLKKDSVDVVFVGTSVTFSSFMPMEAWNQYGMVACNYCTNVQFENSLRYSVREVMKTQSPQLMLIDIAPFMYEHDVTYAYAHEPSNAELFAKYNIDSMKYSMDRLALTSEIVRDMDGSFLDLFFHYFFDIYRYHEKMPIADQWDNAVNDVSRGYGYLPKNGGAVFDAAAFPVDDGSEKALEGHHAEYFQNLLKEVSRLDCDVVFFCAPVYFAGNDEFARKNYVKRVVEEQGYTFWDCSKDVAEIQLDPSTDFWSYDHFDSLGAEKVTHYLAERIVNSYDIPDRRGDAAYANWTEDYQTWQALKDGYNAQDLNG